MKVYNLDVTLKRLSEGRSSIRDSIAMKLPSSLALEGSKSSHIIANNLSPIPRPNISLVVLTVDEAIWRVTGIIS